MINIGEAATRKLGPLPTWAWAGVVGVGVIGYRALRGPAPSNSGSGTQTVIGGDGAGFDYSDLPDLSYGGGGGGATPNNPIGQFPTVAQFTAHGQLQLQLQTAIADLSRYLADRNKYQRLISDTRDLYRDKKISRAERDRRLKDYNAKLATTNDKITTTETLIAKLKQELTALFAAPAA